MKRIFKNKFIACIIAAVVALLAAVFAVFYLNKNDNTVTAEAATSYIQWSVSGTGTNKTLTLSPSKTSGNNKFSTDTEFTLYTQPWYSDKTNIKTVDITGQIAPSSTAYWFNGFTSLTTINNLTNLDTSSVTNMDHMFNGCSSLTSLTLPSSFNTSSVNIMSSMFYGCSSLTSLTLPSNFNTPNLTSVASMFRDCSSLTSLTLPSGFNMSSVTNMNFMFQNCSLLTSLTFPSSLDTSSATAMGNMFNGCSSLTSLTLPSGFKTSSVIYMDNMFQDCSSLTSLTLPSGFNTSSVTYMGNMFNGCSSLTSLTLPSGFNASSVITMDHMFNGCSSLTSLDLSKITVKTDTDLTNLITGCTELQSITLSASLASRSSDYLFESITTWYLCENAYTSSNPVTSAGTYNTTSAAHTPGDEATCTTPQTCTVCGSQIVAVKGHTPGEWIEDKAASCAEAGAKHKECTVCHIELETGTIPATGEHDWGSWAHNNNATNHTRSCQNAGCSETQTQSHTFPDEWVTDNEATEEAAGSKHRDCTECNYRQTETIPQLNHEHTYSSDWSSDTTNHWHAATCGHTTEKKDSAAHDWNDGDITTPASCKAEGVKTYTCTVCNATKTESVPKVSHEWGEWTNNNNATTHIRSCENCTETETQAHTFPETWETDNEATEEAAGSKHRDCTVCGYSQTQTIPQLNHEHKYDNWTPEAPANCTETGTKGHYTCTCELYFDESHNEISDLTIAALDHNWANEWSKDETNHWHACSRCDEKDSDEEHTYDWVITLEPTEEAEGLKEQHCTVCGAVGDQEVIAKLVVDDNGNVSDLPVLPPNQDYDLEISVKESDAIYVFDDNGKSVSKGFKVELFIVGEDGESTPFDEERTVTLMLHIPEGMEDFKLYKRVGNILEPVAAESYTVEGKTVKIKTTLPNEFVFNAPAPEEPSAGIPWWVWLIVGLVAVAIIGVVIIIIVVIKKKNNGDGGAVVAAYDDAELKAKLSAQDRKLDEIKEIVDGGFNDFVDEE